MSGNVNQSQSTPHGTTSSTTGTGGAQGAQAIKGAVGKVHGAGEVIRGNVNSFINEFTGDKAGVAKDKAVSDKGMNEMSTGHFNSSDIEPTTQSDSRGGL